MSDSKEPEEPVTGASVNRRAGWRYFDCEDCGQQWWETTRDRFSPSGTDCTCCNAWVCPSDRKDDPQVLTDANGNVWNYEVLTVKVGKGRTVPKSIKVSQEIADYLAAVGTGIIEDTLRKSKAFREWSKSR